MTIKNYLKRVIEKHLKKLFAIAILLFSLGVFLFIGQNIMRTWFIDRDTLNLIAQNYSMSFKMAYTPLSQLVTVENIISTSEESIQDDILFEIFENTGYFTSVKIINENSFPHKLKEGQILWTHIEVIDSLPNLIVYYKLHNSEETCLEITLPLADVTLQDSAIEGFSIIKDSIGNSIVSVLNESQWERYNDIKKVDESLFLPPIQSGRILPQLENPIARTINNEMYGTTEVSFSIGDNSFTIQLYITEASISGPGQFLLFTVIILFSFFGFTLFLLLIFGQKTNFRLSDEEKMTQLIKKGESESLEFKSSLRWDYKNNDLNKDLEKVIIKSIAAFSNSNGGKLLIGVQDDGTILGLEKDYATLKSADADYFELHLRNLIDKEFGKDFCASQVKCSFTTIENTEIACISIKESDDPVYVHIENKGEAFYVRSGNSSRKIENLSELMRYVKKRF